jgi:hypothetical protein
MNAFGLRGFGDLEDDFNNAGNVAVDTSQGSWLDQYGDLSANVDNTPATAENNAAWNVVTNLLSSTFTNVGQPLINNLVNSSVYGSPAYWITVDGKQVPVYKRSDGRYFTLDATGAAVLLPATPAAAPKSIASTTSAQWMGVAAVGAAALLLIILVMKRR